MTTPLDGPPLDRMQVLNPRSLLGLLREFRNKEWWYTGVYDRAAGIYLSWYFVRANVIDRFVMTVFDDGQPRVVKMGRLQRQAPGSAAGLEFRGRGCTISYRAGDVPPWRLQVQAPALSAEVTITPTRPAFTKFDNPFRNYYGLVHYFHGRGEGVVSVAQGKTYRFTDALVYQDHCYGRVPSRTGWHWIAVQNPAVAVTSLVNYGAYAQRYTQAWFAGPASPPGSAPRLDAWIRLDQNVSFERRDRDDVMGGWSVSSPDLSLEVRPRQSVTDRTWLPPFVSLKHTELFVEAEGQVRVDGRWVDTGLLHGVMEQHHGRW